MSPRSARPYSTVERQRTRLEADDEEQSVLDRVRAKRLPEWMLVYIAVGWVASRMAHALDQLWTWPVGLLQAITMAIVLGVFPAAVIAWHHGEKGRKEILGVEVLVVGILVVGSACLIWIVCT